jgi:hypothetical protein
VADIAELIREPMLAKDLSPEEIPPLLLQLATLQAAVAARFELLNHARRTIDESNSGDRLLTVKDAAEILAVKADYLYRHASDLPFTVRVSERALRFSFKKIQRFIRLRSPE